MADSPLMPERDSGDRRDSGDPRAPGRAALVERFTYWLGRAADFDPEGLSELVSTAELALDWKQRVADGALTTWRTVDIESFLMGWCPAKLSADPADCVAVPVAMGALMCFLEDEGLLAPGSSPLEDLVAAVTGLTDDFLAAMGDRSRFGMAKSLFAAAADEGVDPTDPAQLEGWLASFNDRPEEERRRLLPDTALGTVPPVPTPTLLPIVLPPDDVVAASRASAPVLAAFAQMATFFGPGRRLTQKGNVSLADARVLVELLGTGDVMDTTIGDRTFKTTSSDELPGLRLLFAWAKKAGILRVVHGKAVATKRGLHLAEDPAGCFDRSVDALLAIGPLTSQRQPSRWLHWPEVDRLLDDVSVHLLAGPYGVEGGIPLERVAEAASATVFDTFEFRAGTELVRDCIGADVVDIMDAFEQAGIVRRVGADPAPPGRRRFGGSVELTPAGTVVARRLLAERGYEVPVAGRFVGASAVDLLQGTDDDDFAVVDAELRAWRAARRPEEAAAQMADAARSVDDPALANLALAALAEIGIEVSEPYVRALAADSPVRGFARCWLVDHGLAADDSLFDRSDIDAFVDVLAHRGVTMGPEAVVAALEVVGDHRSQLAVIDQMWRVPSPAAEMALVVLGEAHPSKVVAKAARKARFKRRSAFGNGSRT